MNNINEDLREKQLTGNKVQNRHDWRQLTRNVDPAWAGLRIKEEDDGISCSKLTVKIKHYFSAS
jgi:hypothetical protein